MNEQHPAELSSLGTQSSNLLQTITKETLLLRSSLPKLCRINPLPVTAYSQSLALSVDDPLRSSRAFQALRVLDTGQHHRGSIESRRASLTAVSFTTQLPGQTLETGTSFLF